jgi:hypothetical protein
VRRFSLQKVEAHFDIQITDKEVPGMYLNSDMSVAPQQTIYGCLTYVQKFNFVFRGILRKRRLP